MNNTFQCEKRDFVSPSDHVMFYFYLYYINTNEIPNYFTSIAFGCERCNLLCSHSNGDLFTCEDNMLFSRVRICFRTKAHLVFHWCLYLALINWAGGLHGRILTKVFITDRTQWCLYQRLRSRFSHTDRPSSVNKMFIIWPNKKAKEQKHK